MQTGRLVKVLAGSFCFDKSEITVAEIPIKLALLSHMASVIHNEELLKYLCVLSL